MLARFVTVLVLMVAVSGCASLTPPSDEQRAVNMLSAARTVFNELKTSPDKPMDEFRALWPRAQGVAIFPGLLKAGFILAAEGGNGVLVAKDKTGQWGQPAFYFLAAGSVGPQLGAQATDVVLLIFSQDAVASILEHQGKLGADLGLIIGTIGAGVEVSTTTNIGADVMAFSQGIGAFAGGSLEAAALIKRTDLNEAFYGRKVLPSDIVLRGVVKNPAADGLRAALNAR